MAYVRTLLQLRNSLASRGGFENSTDLTPTVLDEIINDALLETYDIRVEQWSDYDTKSVTTTLTSGLDTYPLPTDFYKMRKLELACDSTLTKWRKLHPSDLSDSTRHQSASVRRFRYRIQGSSVLVLMPVPTSSTQVIRLWYIPIGPQLVNDSDAITFYVPAEQKLVLNIAYRDCLVRQDLDTSTVDREIDKLTAQLRRAGDSRDAGEPFYLGDYADYDEGEHY